MKRRTVAGFCLVALTVGACQSTKNPYDPDKPLDKMTKEEWCNYYTFFLTDPKLSEQTRKIATGQMRAKGCPNAG